MLKSSSCSFCKTEPFTLIVLYGNISVCSGCHQKFPRKPNSDYADPPYDLPFKHMEPRPYNSPLTGMSTSRVGNACYHVYLPYLHSDIPSLPVISPFLLKYKLSERWHKARKFPSLIWRKPRTLS